MCIVDALFRCLGILNFTSALFVSVPHPSTFFLIRAGPWLQWATCRLKLEQPVNQRHSTTVLTNSYFDQVTMSEEAGNLYGNKTQDENELE